MKTLILTLLFCSIFGVSHAQYTPVYTQDLYNSSHYNSAAMGLDKGMYWGSSARAYIDYSAVVYNLRFNVALKNNDRIVLGGKIDLFDGGYNFTSVTYLGRFAYHLVQTEKHDLSLGMEAGFYSLSYHNYYYSDNKIGFDAQVGGHYQLSLNAVRLKIGQSFSNLGRLKDDYPYNGTLVSHSSFATKFIINDWAIEPLILVRSVFEKRYENSLLTDIGLRFSYKDIVWFGTGLLNEQDLFGYHIDLGVTPSFGNTRKNQLQIFFSVLRQIDYSETILELGINYHLGAKKSTDKLILD